MVDTFHNLNSKFLGEKFNEYLVRKRYFSLTKCRKPMWLTIFTISGHENALPP